MTIERLIPPRRDDQYLSEDLRLAERSVRHLEEITDTVNNIAAMVTAPVPPPLIDVEGTETWFDVPVLIGEQIIVYTSIITTGAYLQADVRNDATDNLGIGYHLTARAQLPSGGVAQTLTEVRGNLRNMVTTVAITMAGQWLITITNNSANDFMSSGRAIII